jgi:hypothetical protein
MNEITPSRLLEAWEEGQTQHLLHRALTLLRAGEADQSIDALAVLPIGERDRRLLAIRRRLFGARFDAVAGCPLCRAKLDLTFTADQLPAHAAESTAEIAIEGRSVSVRVPNTIDLLEAAAEPPARRVTALLERCASPDLSAEAAAAAQARMAELDPMAQIEMELACPSCGHQWAEPFDIASYLWTEVDDRAVRLLRETHILAQAYGWSESEILSMNPRRRRAYLDLVMDV